MVHLHVCVMTSSNWQTQMQSQTRGDSWRLFNINKDRGGKVAGSLAGLNAGQWAVRLAGKWNMMTEEEQISLKMHKAEYKKKDPKPKEEPKESWFRVSTNTRQTKDVALRSQPGSKTGRLD